MCSGFVILNLENLKEFINIIRAFFFRDSVIEYQNKLIGPLGTIQV